MKRNKDYTKAEILERRAVKSFFQEKGYEVLDLQQLWRHLHGKLKKGGKVFFLKMASTPAIGERTRNEVAWNNQIERLIEREGNKYFAVPHVYEAGEYEGKFYYLASYHPGSLLASKYPPKTGRLKNWLERIIRVNLFFLSLSGEELHLPKDQDSKPLTQRWDEYFQKIQGWYKKVKRHDLREVFAIVKELRNTYEPAVNHGDFVPWHMIQDGQRFILIDAEHASCQSPRYYDICYFYHRVFTSAQAPELARAYLRRLMKKLPKREKKKFILSIRPILAVRIIGGFWDEKNSCRKNLIYHDKLKNDLLKNILF